MNKVFLSGYLTRDPNYNETKNGTPYVRFGIAVNRQFSKDNEADFFNLIAWNKTAEFCHNYLAKGRKVIVEGRIQNNNYEKDGIKHFNLDVIVENIEFADSKSKSDTNDDTPPLVDDDVDLPF